MSLPRDDQHPQGSPQSMQWAHVILLDHPLYIAPVVLKWQISVLNARQQIQQRVQTYDESETLLLITREYQINAPTEKILKKFQQA
jgi:hypothetical protein